MGRILERYEQSTYSQKKIGTNYEPKENLCVEYPKLVARIELLQRNMRNYEGEELDPLNLRELQSLEQQLDAALKRIRTKKNQVMHESVSQLQKQERSLQDQNNILAKQVKEKEKQGQIGEITQQEQDRIPSLTIGGWFQQEEEDGNRTRLQESHAVIPPWLLPR